MSQEQSGMLSPYLVLDLTDEKGFLAGKLLADMGAEVIKIEKPGGDPSRNIGPFYGEVPDPGKSLYWFAFNTGKKGITLDITHPEGQDLFKDLSKIADVVIESFPPGHLDLWGLGYKGLSRINPGIILTSVSWFGQSGPYGDYKSSDLIAMSMAGVVYATGDPDRPPLRIGFPQAYQFAGAEAAVGSLMALHHRNRTGEGQHVDISIHWSAMAAQYDVVPWWISSKKIVRRQGAQRMRPHTGVVFRNLWPCKDGFLTFYYFGGLMGAKGNRALVDWMESEGFDCRYLRNIDWKSLDWNKVTQEEVRQMEEPTGKFFLSHTKAELHRGAVERGILLYPASTTKDMLESRQLQARGYWIKLDHPELNAEITYPGPFVKTSEGLCKVPCRAPLIGEHTMEIFGNRLGLSAEKISNLKMQKII